MNERNEVTVKTAGGTSRVDRGEEREENRNDTRECKGDSYAILAGQLPHGRLWAACGRLV